MKKDTPLIYLICLSFISFKVMFDYRVCSVAYMECKLREVKREESIMNQFLDPIVDLRYSDHVYLLSIIVFVILTYNYVILEKHKDYLNIFKQIMGRE
tara:strand:+ start:1683 stop:1976 length:294 start_codon:yes stop_codon:yes gene_type:complete